MRNRSNEEYIFTRQGNVLDVYGTPSRFIIQFPKGESSSWSLMPSQKIPFIWTAAAVW